MDGDMTSASQAKGYLTNLIFDFIGNSPFHLMALLAVVIFEYSVDLTLAQNAHAPEEVTVSAFI
jgi:hypothetical protein